MHRPHAYRWAAGAAAALLVTTAPSAVAELRHPVRGYEALVLHDGAVGYWRLGQPSGNAVADRAGASPGVVNGGVRQGVAGAAGRDGRALWLDGITGYVAVPDSPALDPTGDFTVEAWARPDPAVGAGGSVVEKGGTVGRESRQYAVALTPAHHWQGTVRAGPAAVTVTGRGVAAPDVWVHLALVRSGSTLTLYVDGRPAGSARLQGPGSQSRAVLAIGRAGAGASRYFRGGVDEVAVYDRALSAAQVRAHQAVGIATRPHATR